MKGLVAPPDRALPVLPAFAVFFCSVVPGEAAATRFVKTACDCARAANKPVSNCSLYPLSISAFQDLFWRGSPDNPIGHVPSALCSQSGTGIANVPAYSGCVTWKERLVNKRASIFNLVSSPALMKSVGTLLAAIEARLTKVVVLPIFGFANITPRLSGFSLLFNRRPISPSKVKRGG